MVRGLGVCFVALALLWPALAAALAPEAVELESGAALTALAAAWPRDRSPIDPARSDGRFVTTSLIAPSCDGGGAAFDPVPSTAGASRRRFVAVSYCLLFRRLPDPEGMVYWSAQIDAGLSPVEVVGHLIESPEYRARGVRSFRSSLASLTLAAGREEERQQRAEAVQRLEAERDAERAAVEVETKWQEKLRVRHEISAAEFDIWLAGRNLVDEDRLTPAVVHERRYGSGQRINVAYVHLSATRGLSVSPGNRRPATVGRWADEIGATVAINGNWYAPFDGPAVSDGAVYGGRDHHYTALFGFTAEGDAVVEHHREVNDGVDGRVSQAVAGHPTLIHRGQPTTDFGGDPTFTARHPRTVIGLDETGDVLILVTVDGRRTTARGMTGAETVQLMAELGAHDAVMLDGGGSTTMWIAGKGVVNKPSGGLRAVGNQLAVFGD